jgi:hypothetical protein
VDDSREQYTKRFESTCANQTKAGLSFRRQSGDTVTVKERVKACGTFQYDGTDLRMSACLRDKVGTPLQNVYSSGGHPQQIDHALNKLHPGRSGRLCMDGCFPNYLHSVLKRR